MKFKSAILVGTLISTLVSTCNAFADTELQCNSANIFSVQNGDLIDSVQLQGKTKVLLKELSIIMTDAKGNSTKYLKDYNVWRPIDGDDTLAHNPGSHSFKLYTMYKNMPVLVDFNCQ